MHELSLAQGVISLLEEQAARQSFRKVRQVWLEIGALAGVEPCALHFGLEMVSVDTLAQGAQFHIHIQPASGWCLACSQPFESTEYRWQCPYCQSGQVQLQGDREMRVRELEVE